jgi:RimJ/RimL family protein N-acetyltransferase
MTILRQSKLRKEAKVPDQSQLMLTTERLQFETWRPEDKNLLFDLHADPRVQTSYAPGPHKWTMEGIDRRLTGYMEEQAGFGFTKWKLSLSDGTSRRILERIGMKFLDYRQIVGAEFAYYELKT